MPAIKERPILFQGSMIRAVLQGRKTVTRRLVKATKAHADGFMMLDHGKGWWPYNAFGDFASDHEGMEYPIACPYGRPGDRLWVREAWARIRVAQAPDQEWVVYREGDNRTDYGGPWKPGIHMFRRDSRILLEVTDVRVERLQDISDKEIEAEGIDLDALADGQERYDMCHAGSGADGRPTLRTAWRNLWESTGGDWDANPWVWCVSFKRVTP